MRLTIAHTSTYRYDAPLQFGLQELRMTPKSRAGQTVMRWNFKLDGGTVQCRFDDQNNNQVTLIALDEGAQEARIACMGEVETADNAGVIGRHGGFAPVWYFNRETKLTAAGPEVRRLAKKVGKRKGSDLEKLHALSDTIANAATYKIGATNVTATAEEALAAGAGVCQDHAHIFIAAARTLGYPARYVSGYLAMDDREDQDAAHGWAEAHIEDLGWVAFDVSNGMCPDERYVRVATGLDYKQAAPISGIVYGATAETLSVEIKVSQ